MSRVVNVAFIPLIEPTAIANRGGNEVGGHLLHSINQRINYCYFVCFVFINRVVSSSDSDLIM